MDESAVAARLKRFEGCIPYMYKCTGGEVTIGVGHAIETADLAIALKWQAGGSLADTAKARTDYGSIAAAQKGLPAPKYENLTQCRMMQNDIDALLLADIQLFQQKLAAAIPKWAALPGPAQEALFDMGFNLGTGGLLQFHKLLAAVDAGDWETAARECHRMGIDDERNAETTALFRQAGG